MSACRSHFLIDSLGFMTMCVRASVTLPGNQGLVNIRAAQSRGEGEKMFFSVSAPFGGHGEIACPPGSEWAVSVTVPERSIKKTVMVQMSAIDPHSYSAERLDQGYMVSPMVDVQCFQVGLRSKGLGSRWAFTNFRWGLEVQGCMGSFWRCDDCCVVACDYKTISRIDSKASRKRETKVYN